MQQIDWSEHFQYDAARGELIWKLRDGGKPSTWNSRYGGKVAGSPMKRGHIKVGLFGSRFLAHRIIWEMNNGPVPNGFEIDHANGIPNDNRLCNLRIATHTQNMANTSKRSDNKSGLKGVTFCSISGKWRARIQAGKNRHTLGKFDTKGRAAVAYAKAALRYHGAFARIV